MPRTLRIDGNTLAIGQVAAFVSDERARVFLDGSAADRVVRAEKMLNDALEKQVIYGVNTGFGPMATHLVSKKGLIELQHNLIHSHAVGMGRAVPGELVLAAMLVRLNMLAKGYCGVSWELLERLAALVNERIIPEVPEHGAVGTSGDLVQLAHIGLALLGKGYVQYRGQRVRASAALDTAGIAPYRLKPKEGLALINSSAFMTGIMAVACARADRLIALATRTGAWALELIGAFDDGISERLHELRPHRGQIAVAHALRELTAGSRLLKKREPFQKRHRITDRTYRIDEDVQEIYSFRCIPQLLGPALETLAHSRDTVGIEMNAVSDNPIVDPESGRFLHGGNFHGEYIAMASDALRAAMAKLGLLSERRVNFFVNRNVNRRLPPFLNMAQPGLNLALQGLQFIATSTAAQMQTLAWPHRIHSISTNADNQDVVSMGADSALMTIRALNNLAVIATVELITLAQATDVLRLVRRLSPSAQHLYAAVRRRIAVIREDRELVDDLPRVTELIWNERDIDLTWRVVRRVPFFPS